MEEDLNLQTLGSKFSCPPLPIEVKDMYVRTNQQISKITKGETKEPKGPNSKKRTPLLIVAGQGRSLV